MILTTIIEEAPTLIIVVSLFLIIYKGSLLFKTVKKL